MHTLTHVEINAVIREINIKLSSLERTPISCSDGLFRNTQREAQTIADAMLKSEGLNPVCFTVHCNHEGQRFIRYL